MLDFKTAVDYDNGGEYAGGLVSGPALRMLFGAIVLFAVAIALHFVVMRIAAVISLAASVLSLPIYLFNTLPISFLNAVLPYPSKLTPSTDFRLSVWAIAGILSIGVTLVVSVWLMVRRNRGSTSRVGIGEAVARH